MRFSSARAKATGSRRAVSMVTAALSLGLVACGDPGSADSEGGNESQSAGDFMSIDGLMQNPDSAGAALTAEALEATEVTEVVTALSTPLLSPPQGLGLKAAVDQVIAETQARFGADCVAVVRAPGLDILNSAVTFEFTECTGPFQALSISGTSETSFQLDVAQRSILVTTEDDFIIHKDGVDIPVVSSQSGTLSDQGVEIDVQYTGLTGEPRHITGLLEVSPGSNGCVVASLGGTEEIQDSGFQVSNLRICADGAVCVGGVELTILGLGVSLDFERGSFSFFTPNTAPVEIPLPTSAPVCVDAF